MTEPNSAKPYPEVAAQANFPAIEPGIVAGWQSEGTFRRAGKARRAAKDGQNEYVVHDAAGLAPETPIEVQ